MFVPSALLASFLWRTWDAQAKHKRDKEAKPGKDFVKPIAKRVFNPRKELQATLHETMKDKPVEVKNKLLSALGSCRCECDGGKDTSNGIARSFSTSQDRTSAT